MRRSWLYLANRSDRHGAPVLIWPEARPTERSAMKVSSVSPERCETITPQPAALASLAAWIDSVSEPIWLTLSSSALQAFFSAASAMRLGLVTVRSSPTIWMSVAAVRSLNESQSSWSKGSSMLTTGKSLMKPSYTACSSAPVSTSVVSGSFQPRSYLPSTRNSEAATSIPSSILPERPAASMADMSRSRPSRESWMPPGAKPPSSPTLTASWPYFFLMVDLSAAYTSQPIWMDSGKSDAPVGRIMNSCMGSLLPACEPPLMTFMAGTGMTSSLVPARSAMCW
mmetsp:Transcript_15178/g.63102  ORF Transcript_15178/g.63102 Transcript_15178/m.63102 type:complete len:283 (-) Transcript_15178:432-1280(-)